MMIGLLGSDYPLNPDKFERGTLTATLFAGLYMSLMQMVNPSSSQEPDRLISNRCMTAKPMLGFIAIMTCVTALVYFSSSAEDRRRLHCFMFIEALFIFQWNLRGFLGSGKRCISIDEKGTPEKSVPIQITLFLYDAVFEMAFVLTPFVFLAL